MNTSSLSISTCSKKVKSTVQPRDSLLGVFFTFFIYSAITFPEIILPNILTIIASWLIIESIEFLALKLLDKKLIINKWRFISLSLAVCLVLTVFGTPSMAQIFDDAESELEGIGDGGDGIADFFSIFRLLVLLGISAGVVYGGVQAWRSQDVTSTLIGVSVGVIIIVIITVFQNLILG